MDDVGHLRAVTVERVLLAHHLPAFDLGNEPCTDAEAIALGSAQRHLEEVPFGEVVLIEQHRPASYLADDQVELAVVSKIAGDHGAAVAIVVRSGEKADFQEIPATDV